MFSIEICLFSLDEILFETCYVSAPGNPPASFGIGIGIRAILAPHLFLLWCKCVTSALGAAFTGPLYYDKAAIIEASITDET